MLESVRERKGFRKTESVEGVEIGVRGCWKEGWREKAKRRSLAVNPKSPLREEPRVSMVSMVIENEEEIELVIVVGMKW